MALSLGGSEPLAPVVIYGSEVTGVSKAPVAMHASAHLVAAA